MNNSLFISYSRREAAFVDVLLDALEDKQFNVWVDYQCLIPGKPWLEQILSGITNSDAFLLLVSKASMDSKNVELEYQHALEQKKRIILVIFEAVQLPAALQACEWVDFRRSFGKGFEQLIVRINNKADQQTSVPQKGFKTSSTVWITFLVSILTTLISIPTWWTIFIPVLLIPLPYQILRRDFIFYRVRFAVITLPVILLLSAVFFSSYKSLTGILISCFVAGFLLTPLELILLSSKGMRIWGKPSASAPRFANPYLPEEQHPESVPFYIEYAPEDRKYANEIIRGLTKFGHQQVMEAAQSRANLAIISRYKTTITVDPEKQTVYPIIIQDAPVDDKILQRIQWIDFRRGIKNLDNLARLLPNPARLLKALGVAPISQQVIYPRIIQILDYYLVLLGFFSLSIWLPLWLEFGKHFLQLDNRVTFLVVNAILLILILWSAFSSRSALINRTKLASLGRLIRSILWMGMIGLIQVTYIINIVILITKNIPSVKNDLRGSVILFLPGSFGLGMFFIGLLGIWNFKELNRWFPYKSKQ